MTEAEAAGLRQPDIPDWPVALHVTGGLAEAVERECRGVSRPLWSLVSSAMCRRRIRHPWACRLPRRQVRALAVETGEPVPVVAGVVKTWSRRHPPRETMRGFRGVQAERGKRSGRARRSRRASKLARVLGCRGRLSAVETAARHGYSARHVRRLWADHADRPAESHTAWRMARYERRRLSQGWWGREWRRAENVPRPGHWPRSSQRVLPLDRLGNGRAVAPRPAARDPREGQEPLPYWPLQGTLPVRYAEGDTVSRRGVTLCGSGRSSDARRRPTSIRDSVFHGGSKR